MADVPDFTSRRESTGHGNETTMTGRTGTNATSFVTDAQTVLEGDSTQGNELQELLERFKGLKDGLQAKLDAKVQVEVDQKHANPVAEALDKGQVLQIVDAYRKLQNEYTYPVGVTDQSRAKVYKLFKEYREQTKEDFPDLETSQLNRATTAYFYAYPQPGGPAPISRQVYLDVAKWIARNEK